MSSMTLAQIAEKPITVTTDDRISSFADSRQGRLAMSVRRPNPIARFPPLCNAHGMVAGGLNGQR